MLTAQDRVWLKHWQENSPEIRKSAIEWRKQPAFHRVEKPSRITKARRLGYKAKQGIVVIRTRVGTGGMRRQRPVAGRRQKHLGVTRIK
ncbi:MAG: 50S ribosomal protein L15, partial [Candidatus Nitrosotenuis sp.]